VSLPLWFIFNFGITFLVTGFAMWKGGRTEQLAGLFILVATILTFLLPDRRWNDVQFGMMWMDIISFVILIGFALFADRWWTLFAAAVQGLSVLLHLAFWAQMKITSYVYMTGVNIVGHMLLLTLLCGTISYVLRKRRHSRALA
jgi:hypothetical protein